MKGVSFPKSQITSKSYCQDINLIFAKDIVHNNLLEMKKKWRQSLDKGGHYGALLTDLSKAFDCLSHDLLIGRLHSYGFDRPELRLLNNCLTNRLYI